MLLNTFDDVLQVFGVICSGSIQPLSCGIWLTYENYTQELKKKIAQFAQDYQDVIAFYRVSFNQSEIAFKNGWITKEELIKSANIYGKSPYGEHLKLVAEGKE